MNKHEPLWLPGGSVRAILALLTAFTFVYLAVTHFFTAEQVLLIVVLVFNAYFLHRLASSALAAKGNGS